MAETPADVAYAKAVALIEKVRREGGTEISFDAEEFRALDRIPDEIATIKGLLWVILDRTKISDLSAISKLSGLRILYLNGTEVTELGPIAALTGLQNLSIARSRVSDLGALASMIGLRILWAGQTAVSDLAPIEHMTELKALFLRKTQVRDLAPIAALKRLQVLNLDRSKVRDLAPISALTGLESLSLQETGVIDLAPLAGLNRLRSLALDQTLVHDLLPLAALTNLDALWLSKTRVSDLRPISSLRLDVMKSGIGLSFADTPATKLDPELARLAAIEDNHDRTRQTLAYLNTLPPWPEPLPWLKELPLRDAAPLVPAPVPGRGLVPPAGLRRLSLKDARNLLANGHPVLRDRCQRVVADIDEALSLQAIRIPNDPDLLAEHEFLSRTLTLAKAALVGIHDAIPEDLTDQPIDDASAGRLRAAFDTMLQTLKDAAAYVDRKDHSPTYGGLLKLGTATGVATVASLAPGVTLAAALPVIYACLFGPEAAKALKDIGKISG